MSLLAPTSYCLELTQSIKYSHFKGTVLHTLLFFYLECTQTEPIYDYQKFDLSSINTNSLPLACVKLFTPHKSDLTLSQK